MTQQSYTHTQVPNLVCQLQPNGGRVFYHYNKQISVGQALSLILTNISERTLGAKAQKSFQDDKVVGLYTGQVVYKPGEMPDLDIHLNDQNKWTPMSQM